MVTFEVAEWPFRRCEKTRGLGWTATQWVFFVYLQKLKWQGTFHLHPLELLQDGRYLMQLDAMVEQMHEALLDESVWPWNLILIMVLVQQIYWLYIIPRIHQVISCFQKLLPCSNFDWQALSTTSDEVFDLQSDTAPYSCIQYVDSCIPISCPWCCWLMVTRAQVQDWEPKDRNGLPLRMHYLAPWLQDHDPMQHSLSLS